MSVREPFDVVAFRRELHRHPELGFQEFRTASRIAEVLASFGFTVSSGREAMVAAERLGVPDDIVLERAWERAAAADVALLPSLRGGLTAVVGELVGNRPGRTVALRADIDALPVTESGATTHCPAAAGFASQDDGVMHACGHDGHSAIALGVAAALSDRDFAGTVKLVFQPAEEGLRGGRSVAASGILDDVDDLVCIHIGMGVPTGRVYTDTSGGLASTKAQITFTGRAAHAGMSPEEGRNALLAAASVALAVPNLAVHGSALTRANVGRLVAEGVSNIVPASAQMSVEVRGSTSAVCDELFRRLETLAHGTAQAYEVRCVVELTGQAPAVMCNRALSARLQELGRSIGLVSGDGSLFDGGSDDASWLMSRVCDRGGRATYVVLGSDSPSGHHSETFDVDERTLPLAVRFLEISIRALGAGA